MNRARTAAIDNEIALAKELIARGELQACQAHLERAHVLGQTLVLPHARTHWLMLEVEVRRGRLMAAFGQAVRLMFGLLGNAVGVLPVGNTGSSDVPMFKRMPIAPELQKLVDSEAAWKS
jgi:hypothetical protein